jgi:hypothetical protein
MHMGASYLCDTDGQVLKWYAHRGKLFMWCKLSKLENICTLNCVYFYSEWQLCDTDMLTLIMWFIISSVQGTRVMWFGAGNFDSPCFTNFYNSSSNAEQPETYKLTIPCRIPDIIEGIERKLHLISKAL